MRIASFSLVVASLVGGCSSDRTSSDDDSSGGVDAAATSGGAAGTSGSGSAPSNTGSSGGSGGTETTVGGYETIQGRAGGRFVPVWNDEFDGPSVDQSKWYVLNEHQDAWPETPWRRNWKASNVYIENGALVIRTMRDGSGFSTGAVRSGVSWNGVQKFEQAFGRYEARMRFPKSQGHWAAFWLMNKNQGNIDGSGRDGTEIDILEKAWLMDRVSHALHWDGYGDAHQSDGQEVDGFGLDDGGWHTATLEWYPDLYIFYVDGTETWRTTAGGVCQTPNYIKLTEEIGNYGEGDAAWGTGPIEQATLPDYFIIDYVRVWRYE